MRCGSFGGRWNCGFGGEFSGLSGLYTGATEQMSVSEAFGVIYPACHGHFEPGVDGSGTGVNCRDRYAYGGSRQCVRDSYSGTIDGSWNASKRKVHTITECHTCRL
ncbi:hypothetical protein HBI56_045330 [Parastagonospora nodorum]|uniref:Uncharacterized protein n=1 Tax=Phaeosphaeria nodorum (strain SN15 / ATCC MYA-4574 / FGSC 10173) TaxID=321614 RepID=A0A7U2HVD0_PHANO|nr:hypothetical protein HBH56_058450 [Parastagonospora nodorum]QRC91724.1 hypothetical protein JI435_401590 [Parastagonospora nodorum SN15]KAH3930665.1 hypothetical protein HBH54_102380 [Parastagonospora nodorum]KAH3943961.1 hypothetical protein HBH53_167070 [Parastagonospora nodorum]KAH3965289.1 hypothetical protein HBH51_151160 [Parastagonospora nodorum]